MAWALSLLLSPSMATAQLQAPISGPILGYVWDRDSGGLRAILGIPGSSTLSDILSTEAPLRTAEVGPRQDYALAIDESGRVLLLEPATGKPRLIEGAAAAPDRIVLSPTGASAALYYRDRRSFQIVAGLPEAPTASEEIDISGLPALITAVALSDRDGIILLATSDGVYSVGAPPRAPLLVASGVGAGAIAFLENSRDALVADRDRDELIWLRDAPGAAERVLLASDRDGLRRPLAVAASAGRVFVAMAGAVAVVELSGGPLTFVACPCNPSGLHRLKGNSIFRLNEPSADPLFVLDAGAAELRVLFVPSGSERPPEPARATPAPVFRGRGRP